ncbi:DUF2335 domain-containing protein [Tenacibaculum sp. Ill]|uniref:DUF2335 domain-containing protein n=1 Tax=Tenacibaculum sp. Ill TaxID=3445935 RepID=UPI003F79601D
MHNSSEQLGHLSQNDQKLSIAKKYFSGPVPSPEDLMKYEQIIPNGAERFMLMAEKEQEHRHYVKKALLEEDKKITQQEFQIKKVGLFSALGIAILIVLVCFFAFYKGFADQARSIATWGLIGVVSLFITGKMLSYKSNSESDEE